MTTPLRNPRGWQHWMLGLVGALACALLALAWPGAQAARADDSLVLSGTDFSTLHLHPSNERDAVARAQLGAGLTARERSVLRRATVQASAAVGHGRAWRSDAFLLGSTAPAARLLSDWRHVHRAGAVKVGDGGAAFAQHSRHGVSVQVLWRDGSRLGLIVLSTRAPAGQARGAAVSYAVLAAGYLKTPLPSAAWARVIAQVRPDGSVSKQTALEAFALSYGGLPGVRVPSGKRIAPVSGDLAFDWVAPYLPKLPARLRRAIDHDMGFATPGKGAHAADYGDPGFTPNAQLTAIANHWKLVYALPTYLGHYLSLQIVAGTTTTIVHNGYTNTDAPADADSVNGAGDRTTDGPICRIRITPTAAHYDNLTISHILAHEVFHCEEFDLDPGLAHLQAWTTEGLAEWAAETLEPSPGYLGVLDEYFATPATPLFTRNYEAEGFWGHVQDTAPDLWHKIPAILAETTPQGQYDAAGGSSLNFLSTWGSSFFNDSSYPPDWYDVSPQPSSTGAPTNVIPGSGTVLAAPYTTSQYLINATDPLELVTVSPPNDALLGEGVNRSNLTGVLLCAGAAASCQCPPGDTGTVPPSEPMAFPASLGITGDPRGGTSGSVTAIPLSTYCTPPTSSPTPSSPAGADGASGGDPHDFDFGGSEFDFQQAGEFTLVKSTKGIDIQVRQQPLSNCCVSFNTAAAMRVGQATVEVDRLGAANIAVYVNKHRVHGSRITLRGGGRLSLQRVQNYGPLATITWPDGTVVKTFNAGGLGSGVLDVAVTLAADQSGHVTGLLGDAGVPVADEFASPSGHPYPVSVITGDSRHDLTVRYDQFGNAWRITQRESLFRYPRGKSTRSYTIRSFPATFETVGSLPAAKRAAAEKACRAAGVSNGAMLNACELDVAATGDKVFATGDADLQRADGDPGWTQLSPPPSRSSSPSLVVPTLGEAGGKVLAAYDNPQDTGVQVTSFPDAPGAPSSVTHTTAISGWTDLSSPLLVPTADGGQQLVISGTHSSVVADSLNGLDTLALQPNGSFAAPVAIAPNDLVPGAASAQSAVLASDGDSLIWSTDLFLGVFNNTAYPPVAQHLVYPGDALLEGTTNTALAYDTTGRLWLVWYALALANGTPAGLYMEQLDPATGATEAGATPQLVPDSSDPSSGQTLTLACNSTCHIIYPPNGSTNELVSWSPGQAAPVTVLQIAAHTFTGLIGAAAAPDGRIWVVYRSVDSSTEEINARLGDDDGAGGTTTTLSAPPGETLAYDGAVLDTARGLAITANFAKSTEDPAGTLWGTVLPQP